MSVKNGPVVLVDSFTKQVGDRKIVDLLSFSVDSGKIFGLLGGNGSGKTTTIRALLALTEATSGTLHVNGRPYTADGGDPAGYLPEERGLYVKEPVLDVMVFLGRLKGMTRRDALKESWKYLQRTDLSHRAGDRCRDLSGGQQQKVQLGISILANPSLLILDEPAKGMDPVNRTLLHEIVEEQSDQGAAVIIVTHDMDEATQLCDQILFLREGKAVHHGSVDRIVRSCGVSDLDGAFRTLYGAAA